MKKVNNSEICCNLACATRRALDTRFYINDNKEYH